MQKILVIGGTGRLGQSLAKRLSEMGGCQLFTLSRSARNQELMSGLFPNVVCRTGDVSTWSDYSGYDTIIHCAAMKDVAKCEAEIQQCVDTNIIGTAAAVAGAARCGVRKYLYISTDMAVAPCSVYGASKLIADAIVVNAARPGGMQTGIVRLGNIIASKGSIFNILSAKAAELGCVPVTHPSMSRFLMTGESCADFVIRAMGLCDAGETFVPVCPSYDILKVAEAVAPGVPIKIVGLRPGDALSVTMIGSNVGRRTLSKDDFYLIAARDRDCRSYVEKGYVPVPAGFMLDSANNPRRYSVHELREIYNCNHHEPRKSQSP